MTQSTSKAETPERKEAINWLRTNGYPVLAVAPAQDAKEYPKVVKQDLKQGVWEHCPLTDKLQPIQLYTGKNPSYLDSAGFPHLINHRQYQNRLPRDVELEVWFANPENGVGTLGGWNDTVWLDFDVKQFPSQEECDAAVTSVLERVRGSGDTPQQQTLIERSHSGGWRIALKLKEKPNFTNFSLTPSGTHVGEALFTGRFTVLAPTIGPSGNPYQSISRALPVTINSLSAIGIYPSKKGGKRKNTQSELASGESHNCLPLPFSEEADVIQHHPILNSHPAIHSSDSISLESLGHTSSRDILQGRCPTDDRSEALATAIKEWYGWQNWGHNNGIQISGDTIALTHQAGSLLGLDSDRIDRILKTIDPIPCQPAALYRGGEESCWKKIRHLSKEAFKAKCPPSIKSAISEEYKLSSRGYGSSSNLSDGGSQGGDRQSIQQGSGVPESRQTNYPTLWVSEIIAAQCLREYFKIALAEEDIAPGHHIIALEDELSIRKLAQKFGEVEGATLHIYHLEHSLDQFLVGIGINAAPMILGGAVEYSAWLELLKQKPLSLEEAVAIAEHMFKTEPEELQLNLDLEELRQRVNLGMARREMSGWEWDKKYLQPLRKKLEKEFALPAFGKDAGSSPGEVGGEGGDRTKQNTSVTGDSRADGDSQNVDVLSIAETVTTVTDILKKGFQDWLELNKLEAVRVNSELSNKQAFQTLVSGIKSQFDEVQPEDEVKLKALIDWHNAELDFYKFLPSMAGDILHDAKILNIDPIGIWQYLLPTVLSLAGKRVNLDVESHTIPAIAWTVLLAESGSGKTRAKNLVVKPLEQLQNQSEERFKAELAEWEETIANWKEGAGKKPPSPVERKYLFQVGTIQAIMRRQSEQGMNGSVWVRDELLGLFQSLKQFDQKENEALSCLAESWDGGDTHVARVRQEDSYSIKNPRLSITGGLQPGVFKKAFQDPDDSQGLQARFLFAQMKPQKPKRTKGCCYLGEKLPSMYQWMDSLPEGRIKLSIEADQHYDKLYEEIGEQAFNTSMPAIRAWMFKLPAQLLRIALGLHLIECYHDQNRPLWTIQKDTLERAVLVAQYYRSIFHIVQTTAAKTDDLSAILLQIWDKAIMRHPDGISVRDAYRDIKVIQYRAKDAGRSVGAYTADLFGKLEQMGKGSVVKNGRLIKFVANLTPPPISPDDNDGAKTESATLGDTVTIAETIDMPQLEVSPVSEVSPVTVQVDVDADAEQKEVLEEIDQAIAPTPSPTSAPHLPNEGGSSLGCDRGKNPRGLHC